MKEKKIGTKFTILFNRDDPVHVQAPDILNRQPQRGKAHYIAQAIIYFEKSYGSSDARHPAQIDEKLIETVARKMVSEMQMTGAGGLSVPVGRVSSQPETLDISDVSVDDLMESMGEDGMKNMMDALDAFRKK